MADKTVKHFIFSRFFPYQRKGYPYDVLDVDFLSKQLPLAKNMLSSLENQTNKNFDLVFLVNEKFFDNPTYEFVFKTLQDSTTLPLKFIKTRDMSSLVKEAYDNYEFVIQSQMDFDDFIYKDAIADIQNKVNECDNILGYGYIRGYEYFRGELYPYRPSWGGRGLMSILYSVILKSSFAAALPFWGIYGCGYGHERIKLGMKDFLEKNGIDFSENMFQQNKSTDAYIWFRHDFSQCHLVTNPNHLKTLSDAKKITAADITKRQLEDEFGFHLELNSIK